MKRPIYVRALSDEEREGLVYGLRSPDAFVMRRCQILLASSRGKIAREIATDLSCDGQTVRDAIHSFNTKGLDCLAHWSSRPHTIRPAFKKGGLFYIIPDTISILDAFPAYIPPNAAVASAGSEEAAK